MSRSPRRSKDIIKNSMVRAEAATNRATKITMTIILDHCFDWPIVYYREIQLYHYVNPYLKIGWNIFTFFCIVKT
jgi:hypothetical protein